MERLQFKRSLFGYRRRDVEEALDARSRELKALDDCLASAQTELEGAAATLKLRERELARQAERVEELDRVAMVLAERVVERQRELEGVRAELAERSRGAGQAGLRFDPGRAALEQAG